MYWCSQYLSIYPKINSHAHPNAHKPPPRPLKRPQTAIHAHFNAHKPQNAHSNAHKPPKCGVHSFHAR